MNQLKKVIKVRGREMSGDHPHICVPLIGGNKTEIISELENIIRKKPDLVEWRADYFEELADTSKVIDLLSTIHSQLGDIPLLFTIRSEKEGGQPISLLEKDKIHLITEVCKSKNVDIIDYELMNEKNDIETLRNVSKKHNVRMILSYHNFELTPEYPVMIEKYKAAESHGADIVKVSVMSQNMEDVLLLLNVTQDGGKVVEIPIVTISMGGFGSITRMFGWTFGSVITFAIGEKSSAPGQIPIEDLRSVIEIIKKSM